MRMFLPEGDVGKEVSSEVCKCSIRVERSVVEGRVWDWFFAEMASRRCRVEMGDFVASGQRALYWLERRGASGVSGVSPWWRVRAPPAGQTVSAACQGRAGVFYVFCLSLGHPVEWCWHRRIGEAPQAARVVSVAGVAQFSGPRV